MPETEKSAPPAPKRALALDALRGFAILTMCLSGVVPWTGLPSWMYHAQFPRIPGQPVAFDGSYAGYTWVDLVFPMFLFAMGAAFPFAIAGRLKRDTPFWRIIYGIFQRGLILVFFAIYAQHITPHHISFVPAGLPDFMNWLGYDNGRRAAQMLLGLIGFLILFPVFTRFPRDWDSWEVALIRGCGVLAAVTFLALTNFSTLNELPLGEALLKIARKSDIIILVLANVSVWGSLLWLITRGSLIARLLTLPIGLGAHLVHAGAAPDWLQQVAAFPGNQLPFSIGWLYNFSFAKYLFIVIPGTIAGDMMLRWMSEKEEGPGYWSGKRLAAITLLLLAVVIGAHVMLQARLGWIPVAVLIPLSLAGLPLFRHPGSSTERLTAGLYRWSVLWLALGLLMELLEMHTGFLGIRDEGTAGGIKKDPSTMAYYLVSLGLSLQVLLLFIIGIDFCRGARWFWLLISNGQNPMLAYVGIRNLLAPFAVLGGAEHLFFAKLFSAEALPGWSDRAIGWLRFTYSLGKTIALAIAVGLFTRAKVIWRS